ncbi:hypothetical protein GF362_06820 [Candidatus Dojkabacteria bacterium]|nr:hypothetical protein [Candidatus Dojkabacteria bacterium]
MNKIKSLAQYTKKIFHITSLYVLLGLVFTFPLVFQFDRKIPNNLYIETQENLEWGGHLQTITNFRNHKKYLKNLVENKPLLKKENCYGNIEKCRLSTPEVLKQILFTNIWSYTFFSYIFEDIVASNINIIGTFVLSGFAAFFLSKLFIKDKKNSLRSDYTAFFASLFSILVPIRIHILLIGLENGYLFSLFLLLIYCVERVIKTQRKVLLSFIVASLCILYLLSNNSILLFPSVLFIILRIGLYEIFASGFLKHLNKKFNKKALLFLSKALKARLIKYLPLVITLIFTIVYKSINNSGEINQLLYYSPQAFSNFYTSGIIDYKMNVYLGAGLVILSFGILLSIHKFFVSPNKTGLFKSDLGVYSLISVAALLSMYLFQFSWLKKLLYSNFVNTLNYSSISAFLIILPVLTVLATMLAENISKIIKHKFLYKLFIFLICLIAVLSFFSFKPISLTSIPNRNAQFISRAKTRHKTEPAKFLFLPYLNPQNAFGRVYEYNLSYTDSVALNSYNPSYTQSLNNFETLYAKKLNSGNLRMNEFNQIIMDYNTDFIVIYKSYFKNPDIEYSGKNLDVGLNNLRRLFWTNPRLELVDENEDLAVYKVLWP